MTQTTFDDICANRHRGSECSVEANKSVDKAGYRRLILEFIQEEGSYGMTADEASEELNISVNAISGRFTELAARGLIIKTGEKRRTRSGCAAAVWKVKS